MYRFPCAYGTEKASFTKAQRQIPPRQPNRIPPAGAPERLPVPREKEEEPDPAGGGEGRGGRFGMRREEEELERQEGCFPAQLPVEVTQTGNSPPGAAQERSRRAGATLGGADGPSGAERSAWAGGAERTKGPLPPPRSALPGSRRRAGEQRFPGPGAACPRGGSVPAAATPPLRLRLRSPPPLFTEASSEVPSSSTPPAPLSLLAATPTR